MAYDDFEDGTINRWTAYQTDGGTFAASTSAKKYGNYGGRMTTDGTGDKKEVMYYDDEISGGSCNVYAWMRTSNVNGRAVFQTVTTSTNGLIRIYEGKFQYVKNATYTYTDFETTPQNDTWYRLRIGYDGTKVNHYIYDADNTLLESVLDITPYTTGNLTNVYIVAFDWVASVYTVDWDNVCYTDTEEPAPPVTGQYMTGLKYW